MSKNYVENLKKELSELKMRNQKLSEDLESLRNILSERNEELAALQNNNIDYEKKIEELKQQEKDNTSSQNIIYSLYTSEEKDEMLENDKRQIMDLYNDVFQRDKVISEFMDIQKNAEESIIRKIESIFDNIIPVLTEKKEEAKDVKLGFDSEQQQVVKETAEESKQGSQTVPIVTDCPTTDIEEKTVSMTVEGQFLTFIAYDNNTFILKNNTTGQETYFTKQLLNILRFTSLSLHQLQTVIKDIIDFKKVYVGYKYLVLKEKLQANNKKEYIFESISKNEYDEEQANKKNNESNN